MNPEQARQLLQRIQESVELALQGKPEVIRLALTCLVAEGHLLLEDVPGVGKTTLARAIARSLDATSGRIQFTPDLLPSDITGVSVYNQGTGQFDFHPGGIFANIVVADEINRASPKTQAALLEVMEERRVTVDATTRDVPRPFLVIATQNPVDMDGTYPLPEAQLDRFLLRADIGYPTLDAEVEILTAQARGSVADSLQPVASVKDLRALTVAALDVHVAPLLQRYLVEVVAATRSMPGVLLGASPRASLALLRACRAWALIHGRSYIVPEDVKVLAVPVLAHRLVLTPEAELQGRTQGQLVEQLLRSVAVPQTPAA